MPRPENIEQMTVELEIEQITRPENVLESRDAISIIGYEKEPLQKQLINELIIYQIERPENLNKFKDQKIYLIK